MRLLTSAVESLSSRAAIEKLFFSTTRAKMAMSFRFFIDGHANGNGGGCYAYDTVRMRSLQNVQDRPAFTPRTPTMRRKAPPSSTLEDVQSSDVVYEAGGMPVEDMNRQTFAAAVAAILVLPTLIAPAFAQDRDRDRERFERREQFERRERIERHFEQRDWDRWHRGRWMHVRHNGRDGWWWVIGDAWYFYPAPVYPYPDPYALPVIAPPPPAPVVVAPPAPQQQCREYQGDAIINGSNQPFYGTACLEPDGQWHIVSN